jgi:hypothetical protein
VRGSDSVAESESVRHVQIHTSVRYDASEEAAVNQSLTISEIETQFPSEWILLVVPETDESLAVLGGTVRWHSTDRDAVYRKAVELRPQRFAVVYTGEIPEDAAVVL